MAVVTQAKSWRGNILVLGAGGKMGLHVCLMLRRAIEQAESSAQVTAVSRFQSINDRVAFEQAAIQTIACNLSQKEELDRLPDAVLVFFLAGTKFGTASNPTLLYQANVEVPRLVAQRFGQTTIVALSTGCVYPFVEVATGGASETIPPKPVGEYAVSCRGREISFEEAALPRRTSVVIIRLNYSVEFRYGVLIDVATKVLTKKPIDLTTGYVNLIWQRDAVEHIILSSSLAGKPAFFLNVTGRDILSVRQLANDFGRLFQIEPIFEGKESSTAWLNDASLSHRLFGDPATTLDQMEQWVAAWLTEIGTTWNKPTAFECRNGRF